MAKYTNLTNNIISGWTVLCRVGKDKHGNVLWQCRCSCGAIHNVVTQYLKDGRSTRCRRCSDKLREVHYMPNELPNPLWVDLIDNAKVRDIPVNITKEQAQRQYDKQSGKCALSGQPIIFASSHKDFLLRIGTASLDRIDSKQGYTIGNIQWVHKDINKMKNNLTEHRFVELCIAVSSYKDHHGE